MPEVFSAALGTEGLGWMVLASFMAGLVRGFAGFGSGLVLLPVTALFLPPVAAITVMTIPDFLGPVPLIKKAVRDVHLPDLGRLVGAMAVGLPIGMAILFVIDPAIFRYGVSILAFFMLACLLAGVRYRGRLTPRLVLASGGIAGVLGGVAGLPGPPIILLYLASHLPAAVVRATTMLFLFVYDFFLMGLYALNDQLVVSAVVLGLVLALPNVVGNLVGGAIFRPEFERYYRAAAYGIIAVSAVVGLPVWS